MSTTTTKAKRQPVTTQGDQMVPSIDVEILFAGEVLGSIAVPQDDLLSRNGQNVLYTGGIKRGWSLPGTPEEALNALSFRINGETLQQAAAGIHLTAPSIKDGKVQANTGGELLVSHYTQVNVSSTDEPKAYMVNVHTKRLRDKAGQDQGFQLRVQGIPPLTGRPAGPQVVGEVSGLTVVTQ